MRLIVSLFILLISTGMSFSQIDSIAIEFEGEIEFPPQFLQLKSSVASRIDSRNNDYLYSANLSFGLGIYNISSLPDIELVMDIETNGFDDLSVSTLQQVDDLLFVGLGDFQTENPASGLVILDISNPEIPVFKDGWTSADFRFGVSHLDVYDGIVYMSMMDNGLVILDATDETDIKFVSTMVPDLTFPEVSEGHHQGRGLTKVENTLYYTFDRGGLRSIDVSDIYNPKEIQKYINPVLIDKATAAYNDVVVIGNYAYVSVDYCGLEVIDISTDPWTLVEWYDPVDCQGLNWFGAEIHTNELVTACNDSLLFISGGNSEVIVFDITDPTKLNRVGEFFELDNELAAYGLHVLGNKISVSYISNPLNIPYVGNWGGLKVLSFSKLMRTSTVDVKNEKSINCYPNPVSNHLHIENVEDLISLKMYSIDGVFIGDFDLTEIKKGSIDLSSFKSGIYNLQISSTNSSHTQRIVKL